MRGSIQLSAMHDFGTVSHISDATTLHSSKFPVQACWRCLLKNSATLVRSDQTPVEQANATRNVANGSMLKDQKKHWRPRGEPSAWLKFPVQACWRCLLKNSATLVRSLPVQTVLLQGRSNTGLAAHCRDQECCKQVRAQRQKK